MSLKFSESALVWASGKLSKLKNKPGFPQEEAAFDANVAALLRIAHPVLVKARVDYALRTGNRYEAYQPTPEDLAATGEQLEATVTVGAVTKDAELNPRYVDGILPFNPVDSIIDKAVDTFKFFPQPIELRALAKFPPADGEYYGTDDIDQDKDNG